MYREKQTKKTVKLEGGYRVFQFVVVVGGIRHRGCRSPLYGLFHFRGYRLRQLNIKLV